ncbi:carbohydrate-binding family 9-like protein [Segetibacter koreensis]|uniref:carbohydrate-binding family 9-like protein n=1 Tax=Segetibacter koreensis TaxID=398037 RepID=UPI0008FBFDA3
MPLAIIHLKTSSFFAIEYSDGCLCLKYYASEKFAKAIYSSPNERVYKDSCFEFFVLSKTKKNITILNLPV